MTAIFRLMRVGSVMEVIVSFAILAVLLFVASYITKRRFGLLGLALAFWLFVEQYLEL